jgi:copper transport protein
VLGLRWRSGVRRTWLLAGASLLAGLCLVAGPIPALAHALVSSSDPADGANLSASPAAVTIAFTEPADPQLSTIHVLDSNGRSVGEGPVQPVGGQPLELQVRLPHLQSGVYTVSWQTVSAADGHVAGGAFAFGVNASASAVANAPRRQVAHSTPPPNPLGVAGRWVLYVGIGLLVGGAWIALARGTGDAALLGMASIGAVAALVGVVALGESQREGAGVSWQTFDGTALGHALQVQAAPVLLLAVALALAWPSGPRLRQVAHASVLVLAAIELSVHVMASHAPSSGLPWLMIGAQWAHLAAFTVWIGGLAALLLAIRGERSDVRSALVRRFSRVAGWALGLVAVTGLLRAVDEVGDWASLVATLFGQLVLVKVALLVVLAGLGYLNRSRFVPVVAAGVGGLRRVGVLELGVAGCLLVASALLTSLPPPSFVRAAAGPPTPSRVAATGSDYGTTVKARLEVSPGHPGSNGFVLHLVDYDSGAPVKAGAVRLRFTYRGGATIGDSSLALTRGGDGAFTGRGSNLSLAGRWRVTVEVDAGTGSVEVPLDLDVR